MVEEEGYESTLQKFIRRTRATIDRDGVSQVFTEFSDFLAFVYEHRMQVEDFLFFCADEAEVGIKLYKEVLNILDKEFERPQEAGKTTLENGAEELDTWAKDLERREQKLEQVHSLIAEMLMEQKSRCHKEGGEAGPRLVAI